MAEFLNYSISATIQEDASSYESRVLFEDKTGAKTTSFNDRKKITLAPSASAIDIFPTGAGSLSAANLEFLILPTYDASSTLADRYLTVTRDAVAMEMRTFGAGSCDADLTVTNPDATYSVVIEVLFFVRTV